MKFTLILIFLLTSPFIFSQKNLVPNPGFEEFQGSSVSLWGHPLSPYYHFESIGIAPHSGSKCIGLCLWKYDPTEYIQIELTEKLEKGKLYEFKMYVNYNPNINDCYLDSITELGCYFSDTSLYQKNRTQLFFKPQILIPLDRKASWVEKKDYYTAIGNEKFLLMGKYFEYNDNPTDTASIRLNILLNKKIDSIEIVKEAKIKVEIESIKRKYEINSENFDKIKNKKKREKKMNEFRLNVSKMRLEIREATAAIENQNASSEILKQIWKNHCRIRINIDDITLTKNAQNNIIEYSDTIVAGKIFPLKNIFFETNQSELLVKSFEELNKLFYMLKNNERLKIEILGHTDSTGTENHNLMLSEARAKAVVDYLFAKGIDKTRMSYKGCGSLNPISSENTAKGRAENRRVEFKILI